jgi:hypothetical protein
VVALKFCSLFDAAAAAAKVVLRTRHLLASRMGGAISVLLCFLCKSGCSATKVAAHLTFFPPQPPCYRLVRKDNGEFDIEVEEFLEVSAVVIFHEATTSSHNGDYVCFCYHFRSHMIALRYASLKLIACQHCCVHKQDENRKKC